MDGIIFQDRNHPVVLSCLVEEGKDDSVGLVSKMTKSRGAVQMINQS